MAITLSAFTLIPYALVLLQLRVFYAREQPWTPIVLIVVITVVKIVASLTAPYLTDDPELVAGYLGLANGLGFLAGAIVGHVVLARQPQTAGRPADRPRGDPHHPRHHRGVAARRVVRARRRPAAGPRVADRARFGGGGSLLRLLVLGLIMLPIIGGVLLGGPSARRARRRGGRPPAVRPWGRVTLGHGPTHGALRPTSWPATPAVR